MNQEIQIVEECILPHMKVSSKEDVIRQLSEQMQKKGFVKAEYKDAVLIREDKYPTGLLLGKRNVAIPHTEPQYVNIPCIAIATLQDKVMFRRMDASDESVDIDVVLLLALKEGHAHMEMLSCIIGMCQDESFIEKLLQAQEKNEIIHIVKERLQGGEYE